MSVCNFESLNSLTPERAIKSIRKVIQDGTGIYQYDRYYGTTREAAKADERLMNLLKLVSGSGWAMNRNRQCTTITEKIADKKISNAELEYFWKTIDTLPNVELRDLPNASSALLVKIEMSFDEIRRTLRGWDSSSDTLCFLTKVILMFNWGQSPAFDSRIRTVLRVNSKITNKNLVVALMEIGDWMRRFELKFGIRIDKLTTDEIMNMKKNLKPLPLGRSFDMMLYYL